MKKIVLIASNEDLIEFDMTREEIRAFEDEIEILHGHLGKSVIIAKELEKNNKAEVLIARGATATYLREAGLSIPVVQLPITLQDLSNTLLKAKEITGLSKPKVGAIVFQHMLMEIIILAPLLELDVECFLLDAEENINQVIDEVVNSGVDVLMGGVLVYEAALERGLPVALIQSGRESFLQSVREARTVANQRNFEKQKVEELNTILSYTYGGIIAVNGEGIINVFNTQAEKITGIRAKDALNKPSKKLIPRFGLEKPLMDGEKRIDYIIDLDDVKVVLSRIPIIIHGKVTGVVATFQETGQIQQMEKQIRHSLYSKGFITKFSFDDIISKSKNLKDVVSKAKIYSKNNYAIMLNGETGVGKELFAQSIHRASTACDGPFVAVNCAALPDNLLESELFGYVEGAFTGARKKGKTGLFELAHEGTIFLDEISEIPLSLQGRFLRVLQEGEVVRLGDDRVIPIKVRIICATNKDLKSLVDEGLFRDDLYWRLNILNLYIPPLRHRKEDILELIEYFMESYGQKTSFTTAALNFLKKYSWPGNVRELENFCVRLSVANIDDRVDEELVASLLNVTPSACCEDTKDGEWFAGEVQKALELTSGNKARAAEILGIHRVTLWRYLNRQKD